MNISLKYHIPARKLDFVNINLSKDNKIFLDPLKIKKGTSVAFIGTSGAGKTTSCSGAAVVRADGGRTAGGGTQRVRPCNSGRGLLGR